MLVKYANFVKIQPIAPDKRVRPKASNLLVILIVAIITYKTEHESSIRSWTRLALKFIGRGDLEHFLFDRF